VKQVEYGLRSICMGAEILMGLVATGIGLG